MALRALDALLLQHLLFPRWCKHPKHFNRSRPAHSPRRYFCLLNLFCLPAAGHVFCLRLMVLEFSRRRILLYIQSYWRAPGSLSNPLLPVTIHPREQAFLCLCRTHKHFFAFVNTLKYGRCHSNRLYLFSISNRFYPKESAGVKETAPVHRSFPRHTCPGVSDLLVSVALVAQICHFSKFSLWQKSANRLFAFSP